MSNFKNKRKVRKVKDTILIVCGGNTEKLYFQALNKEFKSQLSQMSLCIKKECKSPYQMVEFAIKSRERKGSDKINETWVVFDKDEYKSDNFDKAIEFAEKNSINCAYSNQAFELWFLQHFRCISTALNRNKYKSEINKVLQERKVTKTTYSKEEKDLKNFIDSLLNEELIKSAINNSKCSYQKHELLESKFSCRESSTNVFKLVERLLKY